MKILKYSLTQAFMLFFAAAVIVLVFSGISFARFYCPLGYSYNPKMQLCVGKGSLKGYNAVAATKINVFKGKNYEYICPDKYIYSKKIQLCKGEGSLRGFTAQPTVKTIAVNAPGTAKKSKTMSENNIKSSKK